MIKLDYNLKTSEERLELVKAILEEQPHPSKKYLEILGDYLCGCMSKEEKKEKKILTENRLATVNKRETSLEGLVSKFEYGEDGIYNLLDNNKNTIFKPKIAITEKDLEEIPELSQTTAAIEYWSKVLTRVSGKDAYIAKKALIDARKDQYVIKDAFRKPISPLQITHSRHDIKLPCEE